MRCYMPDCMIVVQISDTHIDLDNPNAAARLGEFERCVAAINRLDPMPDVVVHTGDIAHNATADEYRASRRILERLQCPFLVAVGNRDDRTALREAFPEESDLLPDTPFVQYAIDAYPVRLIVLDTQCDGNKHGDFCQLRADSLRSMLAENTEKPTVIFMHHPPFKVRESDFPVQFASWDSVGRLEQVLKGQKQVSAIFCGHTHRDASGRIGSLPASSIPSLVTDVRMGRYPAGLQSAPIYKAIRFDEGQRAFVSEIRAA
jgi:3',5'-cyclic AMP phosphodiesterase CpdA